MLSKTQQNAFIITIGIVTVATLGFGIYQNAGNRLGGAISLPKVLWLNFALIAFFVIPGFQAQSNRAFRFVWWSFVIRALVEGYLLTQTTSWRCWMGISHCIFTLVGFLLIMKFRNIAGGWSAGFSLIQSPIHSAKAPQQAKACTPTSHNACYRIFYWILGAALLAECSLAWLFSRVANPEAGVFFASDNSEFAAINLYTSGLVAIAYPCLLLALVKMWKGGTNGEAVTI